MHLALPVPEAIILRACCPRVPRGRGVVPAHQEPAVCNKEFPKHVPKSMLVCPCCGGAHVEGAGSLVENENKIK